MGRTRTLVNFPRMKVRGARNKGKLIRHRITYKVRAFPHQRISDGSVRFDIHPEGSHIIRGSYYLDGWGRIFREPK